MRAKMTKKSLMSRTLMGASFLLALSTGAMADIHTTELANEKLVIDYLASLPARDMDVTLGFLAEDVVHKGMMKMAPVIKGKQAFHDHWWGMVKDLEDYQLDVRRVEAFGNTVLIERQGRVVVPGGKTMQFHQSTLFVVKDGKITEMREYRMPKE